MAPTPPAIWMPGTNPPRPVTAPCASLVARSRHDPPPVALQMPWHPAKVADLRDLRRSHTWADADSRADTRGPDIALRGSQLACVHAQERGAGLRCQPLAHLARAGLSDARTHARAC